MSYDLIVIGGGPAGYGRHPRQLGKRVACVEKSARAALLELGLHPHKSLPQRELFHLMKHRAEIWFQVCQFGF